jgi:RNA polymerase sigma-70 factor (ECF subfamily)
MALRHDEVEQVDRLTDNVLSTHAPARDGSVDVTRDKILVERCQAGDRQAFDELYLRYQRRLYRFCMQRLGQAHDAEDVVQESFVRAWRALPRFAGERRFYPWLTVIAANLCVDTLRRRSRLTPVEESRITAADPGNYDIEDAVLHEVDSKMVATAFGHLSTRHQRVLQMREGSEWSYRQIAEHEGVGVTAVETLLWRARQALKREFLILDEQRGKVGALVGFLVMLPAHAVLRLPKAIRDGASHAVDGTRNAVGALSAGGLSDLGAGALGVFGPTVAAATGAVAITVGALILPVAGGPVAGPVNPTPIVTALPQLASPIANASTGTPPLAPPTAGASTSTAGSVSGTGSSGGGLGSVVGSAAGSPVPFGLGVFGGVLNQVASPGAVGSLGSALDGPLAAAVNSLGSAVKVLVEGVSPGLAGIIAPVESGVAGVGKAAGALAPPASSTPAASPPAGTGTAGTGTASTSTTSTAAPTLAAGVNGAVSTANSAVNGLTKALGLPIHLGS